MGKHKAAGSQKARFSAARLAAAQTIYQMQAGEHNAVAAAGDYLDHYAGMELDGELMLEPDPSLYGKIVHGVEMRRSDLETILRTSLTGQGGHKRGGAEKEPEPLLSSVLLCGLYELLAHHDIDAPVIISDYLNVTYAFYDKKEAGLVNAVLDRASRTLRDSP